MCVLDDSSQVCCFQRRWWTLSNIPSYNSAGILEEFLECSMIFSSELNNELIIDAKICAPSPRIQPWSSPDATCSGSYSPPNSASDELVDVKLLLEDYLMGHSSHIPQHQALYIFHFDEGISISLEISKFANYRIDSSWDRPRSLDIQIS